MSRILILVSLLVCTFSSNSQPKLSNEVIDNIALRISNGQNIGMVIGLISEDGVNYFSYGVKSLSTNDPVDEETVFEVGSISKVFTGIMLADQIKKGSMGLNDPIDLHLPNGMKAPLFDGEPIQLVHLSNHTSGLPSLPSNFAPANSANPYSDYTEAQLYEFLASYKLTRTPGAHYEYSNYAAGLLGHILATTASSTYEELMLKSIAKPLALKSTRITLNSKMQMNLAAGHNMGYEVENWDLTTLAGAGAIRSTATDMVRFLKFNMGLEKHKLYETMQLSHTNTRASGGLPAVGLGWHRTGVNSEIIWHNGGTGGYCSFTGFIESEKKGVVILTNSSESVDDLGFHILNSNAPLRALKPSIATKIQEEMDERGIEVAIASYWSLKEREQGTYEFGEQELHRLANIYQTKNEFEKAIAVLKLNIEVYPNSSSSYSSLGEAYFKSDNKEAAINNFKKAFSVSPGNTHATTRLAELGIDTDSIAEKVVIEAEVLESYTGKYELAPGFILTISRNENQLAAQATGQPKFPIFPKSQNVFYLKVVEAQLTFNLTEEEVIKSVTLLQGGREIEGKKL